MKQKMTLEFTMSEIEKINPHISKFKIYVLYVGKNRNNSLISKESVINAIPSLYGVPVVGEFISRKDDFGDHGGKIEVTGDEVKYVDTTKPIGFVPESAKIFWEFVGDKEYLVVDGVYLWTGRYDEAQYLVDQTRPQSMEIEIIDGDFNEEKVYVIKEFVFSGLCVLGMDVEACFEQAAIESYTINRQEMKDEIEKMAMELKFALEGGKSMLTSEQLEDELSLQLSEPRFEDEFGYVWWKYYFVDYMPDQMVVVAKDCEFGYLVGTTYTLESDKVTIDFDNMKRYKISGYEPMDLGSDPDEDDDFDMFTRKELEAHMEKQESKHKEEFTKVQEQLNKLEEFRLEKEREEKEEKVDALFEKFSKKLTEDEMKAFKDIVDSVGYDELETQMFTYLGKREIEKETPTVFQAQGNGEFNMALDDPNTNFTTNAKSYNSLIS